MSNILYRIKKALGIMCHYYVRPDVDKFGSFGKNSRFSRPADIKCHENIFIGNNCRIGPKSTIMAVGNSKLIVKDNFGSAEGLTVITSRHVQEVGKIRTGGNEDNIYNDIVIEEEVWAGINVTLLRGAHIGRGCILGAGTVVHSQTPPYSIVVGNPAKVIGFHFTPDEIIEHEKIIYQEKKRIAKEELIKNYEYYYLNRKEEIKKYSSLRI